MKKIDTCLLFFIILFFIYSLLGLYSADNININVDGILYKQIIWYCIGFLVLCFITNIGNNIIMKNIWLIYIICNFLLLALLFFGPVINNARCWFKIPGFGTFQVSEFVKICLVLVLASFISEKKDSKDLTVLFFSILICLIPSVLTFLEPDTGAVLMYLIILASLLIYRGIKLKWFVIGGTLCLTVIILFVLIYLNDVNLFVKLFGSSAFLRVERLTFWLNKDGLQLNKGLTAIGMGGITGTGFNKNLLYFPEAHTDFIFAVLSSNFGFLGSFIVIITIILFDIYLINIGMKCRSKKDKYIIIGIVSLLFYQQVQNIGMTFGVLPITGITLPFISYGGSSLLSYMIMMGIIMNISTNKKSRKNRLNK